MRPLATKVRLGFREFSFSATRGPVALRAFLAKSAGPRGVERGMCERVSGPAPEERGCVICYKHPETSGIGRAAYFRPIGPPRCRRGRSPRSGSSITW